MAATELIIVAEAGEEARTPLGVGHQLDADSQQQAIDSPTDSSILLRLHRKPLISSAYMYNNHNLQSPVARSPSTLATGRGMEGEEVEGGGKEREEEEGRGRGREKYRRGRERGRGRENRGEEGRENRDGGGRKEGGGPQRTVCRGSLPAGDWEGRVGGARLLIIEQFPDTAGSIISFRVDSDIISLNGKEPLRTEAEVGEDGKCHIPDPIIP
ncbi:putative auxin efflux carrier component 1b [Cinnamomum micranthum f. kanehirae]|uniref:Putative auxin efflux carrier component 1b n=1 Tax=Cinnamomum micranthum f. kanehirae TaxID=337451 RepID=A0A3S3MNW0_9MAGN|nr:putative auxin efflux carrier component 1b [Cinnamomum micranthum f. kanehirae]